MKLTRYRYPLAFLAAACAAAVLWALGKALPCPATAVLAPACASAWELGKSVYWPYMAGALGLWRLENSRACRGGHCAALVCATGLMIVLCKLFATYIPVWCLWCLAVGAGLALYALVLRRVIGGDLVWYTAAILLGIAFLLFTAMPPCSPWFMEPKAAEAMATIPF